MAVKSTRRGFTLVEILIVVIILGILAAIVIPKFASASADAKRSGISSTLQSLRAQIELYRIQHGDAAPPLTGTDWTSLTDTSTYSGKQVGPYVTVPPVNQLNGFSSVLVVATDQIAGGPVPAPTTGFIFNSVNGKLWASNTAGDKVYNQGNPADPNN